MDREDYQVCYGQDGGSLDLMMVGWCARSTGIPSIG